MKVILAKECGFCHGVRHALVKLDKAIEDGGEKQIYSVGEIIHNHDVMRHYHEKGVRVVDSIFDIQDGVGVVRAHGLPGSVVKEAKDRGFGVIDATCPYVRRISKIIEREINEKTPIYLVGEPNHPEVIASASDYSDYVNLIEHNHFDPSRFDYPARAAILSQTTMSEKAFIEIVNAFIRNCDNVRVYNTICPSTKLRQSSAIETAHMVDFMVIVGGKHSSNTKRLFELCLEIVPSYHVERISELDVREIEIFHTAGVTAGASTPDWIIDEAVKFLEKL